MHHPFVIVVFLVFFVRDALAIEPVARTPDGSIAMLAAMGAIFLVAWASIAHAHARLERRGTPSLFRRADRIAAGSAWLGLGAHVLGVTALGWLDDARRLVGDSVALDECVAAAPVILLRLGLAWAYAPVETLARSAILIRRLDEGRPVYPPPSRGRLVLDEFRHHMALSLVPLAGLLAWSEGIEALATRWAVSGALAWLALGVQVAGALGIFAVVPLVMRHVWDASPMPEGPLRERLEASCARARVRVRDVLIWHTHGVMINGAVMGVLPRARFILLTDALLDALDVRGIEAVAAHEIGHIRHRHVAWIVASISAAGACAGLAASWVAYAFVGGASGPPGEAPAPRAIDALTIASAAGAAIIALGFVSRRFEWQADAFAAAHLSREASGVDVSRAAVEDMRHALREVAAAAGMDRRRVTWRHGSIAERERRLDRLIGRRIDDLPIDRVAGWIKAAALAGVVAAGAGIAMGGRA